MAMIDDATVVASLLQQMEAHLPIPAQVTPEVRRMLRSQQVLIPRAAACRLSTSFTRVMKAGLCVAWRFLALAARW